MSDKGKGLLDKVGDAYGCYPLTLVNFIINQERNK